MDAEMYDRIVVGIDFLNDKFGSLDAWIDRVRLGILDMRSIRNCLICQLFGDYAYFMWEHLSESTDGCSGHQFGFDDQNARYYELTEAWQAVISGLRSVR